MTKTDTTAFKLPFFTNPNNPLHEKLIASYILLVVAIVVIYLLVRYLPILFKSFFRFNPIAWTVATLGGTGIVCKIADRFPGNYKKIMETPLDPSIHAYIELFEETTESALPLLFALALIQYHFSQKKSRQPSALFVGGERGIRTPGKLPFNGFQDRRIRPLCHLSEKAQGSLRTILVLPRTWPRRMLFSALYLCVPRKKSASVPGPEWVPMTLPT